MSKKNHYVMQDGFALMVSLEWVEINPAEKDCPTCKGKSYVAEPGPFPMENVPCSFCYGTGKTLGIARPRPELPADLIVQLQSVLREYGKKNNY